VDHLLAPGQKLYAEIAALNAALPERLERLAIEDQLCKLT
jgi:hypothetical protein